MALFHFLYDLNFNGVTHIPLFRDPFWIVYREILLFLFMGVSGICLFLNHGKSKDPANRIRWANFWRRFFKISMGAALITLGTYLYNPRLTVWFGILHFFAFASLASLPFVRFPSWALPIGFLSVVLGHAADLKRGAYYIPYLAWVGCGSDRLRTFEVIPVIPYLGYLLLGIFIASLIRPEERDRFFISLKPNASWVRILAFLGRHSFLIYFLHRPVTLGAAYLFLLLS